MSLTIEFTPQAQAWIQTEAERQGVPATEVVRKLVEERLPEEPAPLDAKTAAAIAQLDQWIAEGLAADPETRRQADQEVEELKRNLNANRAATGERLVFP